MSDAKTVATPQLTSDHGIVEGKLVQFVQDLAPYCKNDIVRLDSEAEKYVKARVRALHIEGDVYRSKIEPEVDHTEGNASVVVGAVQAVDADQIDQPTTVHGGTVQNEQDAPKSLKPSDAEIADRSENPKNPRGDSPSQDEVAAKQTVKA